MGRRSGQASRLTSALIDGFFFGSANLFFCLEPVVELRAMTSGAVPGRVFCAERQRLINEYTVAVSEYLKAVSVQGKSAAVATGLHFLKLKMKSTQPANAKTKPSMPS
jgi:hypothetical protein